MLKTPSKPMITFRTKEVLKPISQSILEFSITIILMLVIICNTVESDNMADKDSLEAYMDIQIRDSSMAVI